MRFTQYNTSSLFIIFVRLIEVLLLLLLLLRLQVIQRSIGVDALVVQARVCPTQETLQ